MKCIVCGEERRDEDDLIEHMNTRHSSGGARASNESSTSSLYPCPFCTDTCSNEEELGEHVLENHVAESSRSPAAKKPRNQSSSLQPPSSSSSQCSDDVRCPVCGSRLTGGDDATVYSHILHSHPGVINDDAMENTGFNCPVCAVQCDDQLVLQQHVNTHFSESDQCDIGGDYQLAQLLERQEKVRAQAKDKEFEKVKASYGMSDSCSYSTQGSSRLESDVVRQKLSPAEFHHSKVDMMIEEQGGWDSGITKTTGIIELLRQFSQDKTNSAVNTWLCTGPVDHYSSGYGDKGWGCGYRNIQMLLSSLKHLPHHRRHIFNDRADRMFSITKLQKLIEDAWRRGFDADSRDQLGGVLVGKRTWIGTMEAMVLLHYHLVRAEIYEFHEPTNGKTHPLMFEWILEYFQNNKRLPFISPLYIQHQGHSRCVVGVERSRPGNIRLLIFDPSTSKTNLTSSITSSSSRLTNTKLTLLRRTISAFKRDKYQLLCLRAEPLPGIEPDTIFKYVTRVV